MHVDPPHPFHLGSACTFQSEAGAHPHGHRSMPALQHSIHPKRHKTLVAYICLHRHACKLHCAHLWTQQAPQVQYVTYASRAENRDIVVL